MQDKKLFLREFAELIKKHNLTLFSGKDVGSKASKDFEGFEFFVTDGTQSLEKRKLKIGQMMQYGASTVIHFKNKRNEINQPTQVN